ncbi:MAG: aerial mycelium formation protein [Actinomycetota bacterium]|nr:aerial mycelium formation protein [Actinomycetota bacterium]
MVSASPPPATPAQRRLDRVLDPAYLEGLSDRPVDEIEAMKTECVELETEASFVRRLAQARIDILEAERRRRRDGGSLDELIAGLAGILSDEGPRPSPAQAHLPQVLHPSPEIEWTRGLEPLVGDATLVRLPDLSEDELARAEEQLRELETEVSAVRHRLHEVLHTVEMELAARIRAEQ